MDLSNVAALGAGRGTASQEGSVAASHKTIRAASTQPGNCTLQHLLQRNEDLHSH